MVNGNSYPPACKMQEARTGNYNNSHLEWSIIILFTRSELASLAHSFIPVLLLCM